MSPRPRRPRRPRRSRRLRPALAAVVALCVGGCSASRVTAPSAPDVPYPDGSLEAVLEPIRRRWNLPAFAAVVVTDGRVHERAVVGVRRAGDTTRAQLGDRWHLGSITKSVTASVAARLVDRGRVRWETTIGEALPDLAAAGAARWRAVTLADLLTMRAGVDDAPVAREFDRFFGDTATDARAQRRAVVARVLASAPTATPGTRWTYANASYVVAGHMLERIAGVPWETLVRDEVLAPLALATGGFGAPATPGRARPDQPWGHTARGLAMTPVAPGPRADNPPALGPAGTLHLGLDDLGAYAVAHLASARGGAGWLSAASGARVHAAEAPTGRPEYPAGSRYAMGWLGWTDARAANTPILAHDGSNTNFYTYVWLAPARNAAIVVTTNAGGAGAGAALDSAVTALARRAGIDR